MRRFASPLLSGLVLLLSTSTSQAQSLRQWDFNTSRDREGWTVPADMTGLVNGGSLWLTLTPIHADPDKILVDPMAGDINIRLQHVGQNLVESSRGLGLSVPSTGQLQVKLRILNLSPVTDAFIRWRAKGQEWQPTGWIGDKMPQSAHFALKADVKRWQEVIAYIDKDWRETIDQIAILLPQRIRGDIWIDSVEIVAGPDRPAYFRPDISSAAVVPKLTLPGISQHGFADAFKVMDECMFIDVPRHGFSYPLISPGGGYHEGGWWALDTALALSGAKWANPTFAEDVMRGFREVQLVNPDGRIDVYNYAAIRGQPGEVSIIPVIFPVAYDIAHRTSDPVLRDQIFELMRGYLDWWLSPVKRDAKTGLVWGFGEETFSGGNVADPGRDFAPRTVAPLDLNSAVAVGAHLTADLASALGREDEARNYRALFADLARAINQYLWDETEGAYYAYNLVEKKRMTGWLSSATFHPIVFGIASSERRERLLQRLLDPSEFNWGKRPVTTVSMKDAHFVEAEGHYDGRAWYGNVWTSRNTTIIEALENSGRHDLAADLAWSTVKTFHRNFTEFANPSTGKGHGVSRYAYTASQYVSAIVDHLFGIDYDAIKREVRITPRVPKELYGQEIAVENLILPGDGDPRLSVRIKQASATSATIALNVTGKLPAGEWVVALPGAKLEKRAVAQRSFTVVFP